MLKQIAWNTFKTTGNINTMLELLEVDKTINNIKISEEKRDNNISNNYINLEKKDEIENNKKWEL
jgi:hypothetical protein